MICRRISAARFGRRQISSAHGHLKPHLSHIQKTILTLLTASSPALTEAAQYYFLQPSKLLRPLLVLLFSQATNGIGASWPTKRAFWNTNHSHYYPDEPSLPYVVPGERFLDLTLTGSPGILNDWNPALDPTAHDKFDPNAWENEQQHTSSQLSRPTVSSSTASDVSSSLSSHHPSITNLILPTQMRLAEILELIHGASLLHDDVIDAAPLRRGVPSAPWAFQPGAKMTVMAGTFVLGRASALLSRLGDSHAIELVANIVRCLVEGEVLQMGAEDEVPHHPNATSITYLDDSKQRIAWSAYLQKTYMKTASLMAKGCRAAVSLGGCQEGQEIWNEVAYAYGRNLGISFQLVDDILDFTQVPKPAEVVGTLGKPANADLALGLATGPALYAWEEHPQLEEMISRRFTEPGDVERARSMILDSSALDRTRALAQAYADQALKVLEPLPDSLGKRGLEGLAHSVVNRVK